MTVVEIVQVENKTSKSGQAYRKVGYRDAAGNLKSGFAWDEKLSIPASGRVDLTIEDAGGQFPRITEAHGGTAPGGQGGDGVAERIYRCTALNNAVALLAHVPVTSPEGVVTPQSPDLVLRVVTPQSPDLVLRIATMFYGWLLNEDEEPEPDGVPF